VIAQRLRAYGPLHKRWCGWVFDYHEALNTLVNQMVDTVGLSVVECGYQGESGPSIKGMRFTHDDPEGCVAAVVLNKDDDTADT
jgi:hypothetical protein